MEKTNNKKKFFLILFFLRFKFLIFFIKLEKRLNIDVQKKFTSPRQRRQILFAIRKS